MRLWDIDQKTADAYMVADKRLSDLSNTDEAAVRAILAELDADWLPALGFDAGDKPDDDAGDLGADLEIRKLDTDPVADTFHLTVRGPLELRRLALTAIGPEQAHVFDAFAGAGEMHEGVLQIPAHRGQSFRRIADSVPVIADSF